MIMHFIQHLNWVPFAIAIIVSITIIHKRVSRIEDSAWLLKSQVKKLEEEVKYIKKYLEKN